MPELVLWPTPRRRDGGAHTALMAVKDDAPGRCLPDGDGFCTGDCTHRPGTPYRLTAAEYAELDASPSPV